LTWLHPELPEAIRGTYQGRNGCAVAGIRFMHTAMQTLVVQQFTRHLMRARVMKPTSKG
jgi:hypothetical protein